MEKEQLIATLEHENRQLSQEKHNLMTRLETSRDRIDNDTDVVSARVRIGHVWCSHCQNLKFSKTLQFHQSFII